MDITSPSQARLSDRSGAAESAPREPLRWDAASWLALAAFVAYLGIGILA